MCICTKLIVLILLSTGRSNATIDPCAGMGGCTCNSGIKGLELYCKVFPNQTFDFQSVDLQNISSARIHGEDLRLNENEFKTVYYSIQLLTIEGSNVRNKLTKKILSQFPNVKELVIRNCSLVDIELGAFSGHENLQVLDVSKNRNIAFDMVEKGLEHLYSPKLRVLNLSLIHNPDDTEDFPIGRISFNLFTALANTSLEVLDVSWTKLFILEASALYIPRLKSLNFSGTALFGSFECLSTFLVTGNISEIIFDYWPFTERTNTLPVYTKPRYKYSVDERCVSTSIITEQGCYRVSDSIKTVQAQNSRLETFYIDISNPICLDAKGLVNWLLSGVYVSKQFAAITGPTNVKVFDLSYPKFSNNLLYFPAVNESIFKSMPLLEIVLLPGNRLNAMNVSKLQNLFANNSKLQVIDLSSNRLVSLPLGMFQWITSLKRLNLSQNELTTIDFEMGNLKLLEVLDLSYNKIKVLSEFITEQIDNFLYSSGIYLENNMFDCNCTNNYINNIISLNIKFLSMSCNGEFGFVNIFKNETMSQLPLTECNNNLMENANMTITLPAPVLIVIFIVLVCFIFVLVVRLLHYRRKRIQRTRNPLVYFYNEAKPNDPERTPKFKAFLAFSHSDELIVFREIMPKLESFLKDMFPNERDDLLCIYDKHFLPGDPIDEVCEQAVLNSHVIIAVISKGFLNSTWCNFEIKRAYESSIKVIPLYLEECEPHEYKGIFKAMFDETIRLRWPHDGKNKEKNDIVKKIADAVFVHVKSQKV